MPPLQLRAEPLSHVAWEPYGDLIVGTDDPATMPASVVVNKITHTQPQGHKFNRVSRITNDYPAAANAVTSISVIRIGPPPGLDHTGSRPFQVRMLEKHVATSQAFVPMQRQPKAFDTFTGEEGLPETEGGGMLVMGCLPKDDGSPDFDTLKVFVAAPSQGVCYRAGVWHHSCISFAHADLIVVDTQVTTDCSIELDCQFVRRTEQEEPFAIVELPELL